MIIDVFVRLSADTPIRTPSSGTVTFPSQAESLFSRESNADKLSCSVSFQWEKCFDFSLRCAPGGMHSPRFFTSQGGRRFSQVGMFCIFLSRFLVVPCHRNVRLLQIIELLQVRFCARLSWKLRVLSHVVPHSNLLILYFGNCTQIGELMLAGPTDHIFRQTSVVASADGRAGPRSGSGVRLQRARRLSCHRHSRRR